MEIGACRAVKARLLPTYPFLWCWDLEDATGRRLESSWEDHWDAFSSSDEPLTAALARLDTRFRVGGTRAASRRSVAGRIELRPRRRHRRRTRLPSPCALRTPGRRTSRPSRLTRT